MEVQNRFCDFSNEIFVKIFNWLAGEDLARLNCVDKRCQIIIQSIDLQKTYQDARFRNRIKNVKNWTITKGAKNWRDFETEKRGKVRFGSQNGKFRFGSDSSYFLEKGSSEYEYCPWKHFPLDAPSDLILKRLPSKSYFQITEKDLFFLESQNQVTFLKKVPLDNLNEKPKEVKTLSGISKLCVGKDMVYVAGINSFVTGYDIYDLKEKVTLNLQGKVAFEIMMIKEIFFCITFNRNTIKWHLEALDVKKNQQIFASEFHTNATLGVCNEEKVVVWDRETETFHTFRLA